MIVTVELKINTDAFYDMDIVHEKDKLINSIFSKDSILMYSEAVECYIHDGIKDIKVINVEE